MDKQHRPTPIDADSAGASSDECQYSSVKMVGEFNSTDGHESLNSVEENDEKNSPVWQKEPEAHKTITPSAGVIKQGCQYGNDSLDSHDGSWEDMIDEEDHNPVDNPDEIFRKMAAQGRIENRAVVEEDLPSTVTVLNGPQGEKVYLIGTAHFSVESCDDVKKVIRDVQPDVVVIELCRNRMDILHNDEKKLIELAGEMSSKKILNQIRDKGIISGLMTFFLLHMSAHITKQLGMAPGSEFRTAYREAHRIPGCKVMYGDRAVDITLQRAFAKLPIWQRLKFAFHALKDLGPIKPEDIEKLKKKDLLEQALEEMMEQFPQMTKVFLAERDIYLARSMQLASTIEVRVRDGAVPPVVVGVVGLGHAAGVAEHFRRQINFDEMAKLMEVPRPSKSGKIVKIVTKLFVLFLCGYGLFKFGLAAKSWGYWLFNGAYAGVKHLLNRVASSSSGYESQIEL